MLHAIANPKRNFTVNFSQEEVLNIFQKLPIFLLKKGKSGYNLERFDPILNQIKLLKTEFLSLGVRIIISANKIDEKTTSIEIEIERAIGTFNQSHEVTAAHIHLKRISEAISELLQNPTVDLSVKEEKPTITSSVLKILKNGILIFFYAIGVLTLLFIFGVMIFSFLK